MTSSRNQTLAVLVANMTASAIPSPSTLMTPAIATASARPSASMPNASAAAAASAAEAAMAAQLAYISHKFYVMQLFLLLGYSIMFGLCAALICYMRYNRHVALKGDASAARKLILPAFEPLLWILCATTGAYSLVLTGTLLGRVFETRVTNLATEGFYCGRMFVFLTVIIYMLQKSVTVPALVRTVAITLVLSTYTIPVELVLQALDTHDKAFERVRYLTLTTARCLLLLIFTYVMINPPGRASKRALREYCAFVYGYYALMITYSQLLQQGKLDEGFATLYTTLIWAAMCPLVIWRVLVADTHHWRGMGQRAVALQSLFRQKHNINERISSQGLHVLIEMHRKLIIDFAYLELKQKIGTGASAIVFNGVLHSRTPVAIKVYTPTEFSEETVAEFSQEAALCGALNHPNIVTFYGMCVCPPTICLVSELCQGSLDDITRAVARHHQPGNRQQQLINIGYMIDAARALAYIHSFTPAFVHRDIKPDNFLVDVDNTVKLTDFGESRSLPKAHMMTPPVGALVSGSFLSASHLMKSGATLLQEGSARGRQSSVHSDAPAKMTVKGTVDYMAPEIIQGRAGVAAYGEAADVYSLAITMWDILNPGKEKFPALGNNHLQVFEYVMEGKRPVLDQSVHPSLRELIEGAWHGDPRMRPTAHTVVSILESVQEELFAVFAADLSDELEQEIMRNKYGEVVHKTFSAQHAIERMEELSFVNSSAEALRLGNALMDAGLLHHWKHERPFESADGLYFFDEDNINLCQPIMAPGEADDVDEDERVDHLVPLPNSGVVRTSSGRPMRRAMSQPRRKNSSTTSAAQSSNRTGGTSHSDHTMYDNGMCPCRKLGQRLEQPKTAGSKRRFRKHRNKAVSEDNNHLTAKLLAADTHQMPPPPTHVGAVGDFDEFDAVATAFRPAPGGIA